MQQMLKLNSVWRYHKQNTLFSPYSETDMCSVTVHPKKGESFSVLARHVAFCCSSPQDKQQHFVSTWRAAIML